WGAADGHGVHPVPPDHLEGYRYSDHRGRTRRRRLPPEYAGRAVYEEVRPGADGASHTVHRVAGDRHGDRRGAPGGRLRASGPAPPGPCADPGAATADPPARAGLRRSGPDRITD